MNKWVVDTCVIIDVLSGDGEFSGVSPRDGFVCCREL